MNSPHHFLGTSFNRYNAAGVFHGNRRLTCLLDNHIREYLKGIDRQVVQDSRIKKQANLLSWLDHEFHSMKPLFVAHARRSIAEVKRYESRHSDVLDVKPETHLGDRPKSPTAADFSLNFTASRQN